MTLAGVNTAFAYSTADGPDGASNDEAGGVGLDAGTSSNSGSGRVGTGVPGGSGAGVAWSLSGVFW